MHTKKKSIDIQIKYFFPVYIKALLNKLFIDNKRHHACIISFLFVPQLYIRFITFTNTVDIFIYFICVSALYSFHDFNEDHYGLSYIR